MNKYTQFSIEAGQHGDVMGAAIAIKAADGYLSDLQAEVLTGAELAQIEGMTQAECRTKVDSWIAENA